MFSTVRVLAPNPGVFTGPGTNTYVAVSGGECVIIDPGPVEESHRLAILGAVDGLQPRAVLVTHTHPDHAPLANPLAERLGVAAYGYAPGPEFAPDRRLRDGDRLRFGEEVLEVLHTPGHSDDHLCFRLGGAVFTGDHIMGGSTVIVEDMARYLRSLERLREWEMDRLLPGHGEPMDRPYQTVDDYLAHRLMRERQIMVALEGGATQVGEIVEAVYRDVDRVLHPLAARSVLAHLVKLEAEGKVGLPPPVSGEGEGGDAGRWERRAVPLPGRGAGR